MTTSRPVKGDRFQHARWISGSPKAGTARPVECQVFRVARHNGRELVWYGPADGAKATHYAELAEFSSVVR